MTLQQKYNILKDVCRRHNLVVRRLKLNNGHLLAILTGSVSMNGGIFYV